MAKVLIVATSRKTRGGITSVVKAHESGEQWKKFHCHWVQTHRDGSPLVKIGYLLRGAIDFTFRLPFYDVVHFHVSQPTTIKRKKPFLKLAKWFGKKIIIHFHAFNIEETFDGKYSQEYLTFFNAADSVIVLSEWWKAQIKDRLSLKDEDIRILYNPCPSIDNEPKGKKETTILYAGTINQRKGYSDLIKAFALIANSYPEWKVVFAGNGEIEEGKRLAKELGIANQIVFEGWVSGEKKDKLFRKSSIFCLPSYAEGFPMAVLDAWAYGLPVITTPVGGIPDVAIDKENMLLFEAGATKDLASCLSSMISDVSLRNKISKASISFAKNKFSIQSINKELERIYSDLCQNKQ